MNYTYLKAKEELLTASEGDCQQFFVENNCVLESAYCALFKQNSPEAKKLFAEISDIDIRAHWGYFFTGLCTAHIDSFPSYFELRNFFEIDFNLLFRYYIGNYIEGICKYTDWLSTINPEICKYIGRVFLKNEYKDFGLYFMKKGLNYLYKDPELHFLFAEYYFSCGDYDMAQKYAKSCLDILPGYFPAKNMQEKLGLDCI